MALAKTITAQTDFSAGEVDTDLKLSDDPVAKIGVRQATNFRLLDSKKPANRSGRRAVMIEDGRVEKVTMAPGEDFYLAFKDDEITVFDADGAEVFNETGMPWVTADLGSIVWDVYLKQIFITFLGNVPQVLSWDGVSTWAIADFAEQISAGGQKRTPFYRISPAGITMLPSATTGAITVTFSEPIVVAGMVGTRVRFCGRQILLGSVSSSTVMNATVVEPLPPAQTLTLSATVGTFNLGDVLAGNTSTARGIVTATASQQTIFINSSPAASLGEAVTGGTSGATGVITSLNLGSTSYMVVQLSTGTPFQAAETMTGPAWSTTTVSVSGAALTVQLLATSGIVRTFTAETVAGPSGTATVSGVSTQTPKAVTVWDEEVMNSHQGYPASCFVDQNRLGFCDFPGLPGGIAWSAIGIPEDLNVGAEPDEGMFELAPRKSRVLHVVGGPEAPQFVFCDNGVYYIPISETNPLRPGSVAFKLLSRDGCASVQPRSVQGVILYIGAGQTSVMAAVATGLQNRPFETRNVSELHSHLVTEAIAIAVPTASGDFPERYAYVLNSDGTLAVMKYQASKSQLDGVIGWTPHSGNGTVRWIAAHEADVIFSSTYFSTKIVEVLDNSLYLDAAVYVNDLPDAISDATPPGDGPLWFLAGQTVTLMDLGTRQMGEYDVDADGNLVPQSIGGEDLTSAQLVAGQPWTATLEPFVPRNAPGQSFGQRMKRRKIARWAVSVLHSTGFIADSTRVPTYRMDENAAVAPTQREETITGRQMGRSHDPRFIITKDTAGPLTVLEVGIEATV